MVNVLLNTLVAFLMGGATLSFSFTASGASGEVLYSGEGTAVTSGECYRVDTPQMLVVCDGELKGIYQKGIDEIVLQPVNSMQPGAQWVPDNPFALLKDAEKYYKVTTWANGKKVTSAAQGVLPSKVELKAKNGETYTVELRNIRKLESADKGLFTLNPDDYPTAVVTDLR